MRLARRAWGLLHEDSARAITLADRALTLAQSANDASAEAWARLARGFHLLYFATPGQAEHELELARQGFAAVEERAGIVLAGAGLARALWRAGRFREAVERVLPLRDEGLQRLKHEQRSVLLNIIAGCYSAEGRSEQAFAYMFEALRDSRRGRSHGYDAVLHCNIAHELLQLGDYHEALRHIDQGIERVVRNHNPRLHSVLLINRVICLTELGRASEALPDVRAVCNLPADASGRGTMAAHFETLAVAALQAGEQALGSDLVDRALAIERAPIPDEHLELAVAEALRESLRGDLSHALMALREAQGWADDGREGGAEGSSLRIRCLYWLTLSRLQEQMGRTAAALDSMRVWQRLHVERAELASRARYQAAALQTELLRLQHKLEENDARRRATERARAELEAANLALSRKMQEVQSLQAALRELATRDELTGLFNRRHLNDVVPAMLSMAQRDGQPLAAVMIDLDWFKAINDNHGHDAGDRLLAGFGRLLARYCRKSDLACRWGGEEFCMLLPHTDARTARRKVLGLLRRWRDESTTLAGVPLEPQTFSAGVSDTLCVPGGASALLLAADAALLEAKCSGRKQVQLAASAPPSAHESDG